MYLLCISIGGIMKNKWKNYFWGLVGLNLIGLLISPYFKQFIKGWILSFGTYSIQAISLFIAIDAGVLAVLEKFYNDEYKENLDLSRKEDLEVKRIILEMENNISILNRIINYMETNNIKEIYFYPDDKYEFWNMNDGTSQKVECRNNKGILSNWKLSIECKEYDCIQSKTNIREHYIFISEFNGCNGFPLNGVKYILEKIKTILYELKTQN